MEGIWPTYNTNLYDQLAYLIRLTHMQRKRIALPIFLSLLATICLAMNEVSLNDPAAGINPKVISRIENKYNAQTANRMREWTALIEQNQSATTEEKLYIVNNFFNDPSRIQYTPDSILWNKFDYWASPVEFLLKGAGDCEDYAIAKFFTLTALGVPQEQLKITYVYMTQKKGNASKDLAHMVLGYYASSDATPLILDNAYPNIKSASERTDLRPVLAFNGLTLWESRQRKNGARSPEDVKPWVEMNNRTLSMLELL